MLNRVTTAEGLPDGSVKPGEGFVAGFVPDLEWTARRKDDGCWLLDDCPKTF